ncbi:AraC family transcriptional regulator [Reichenbachiella sp. MALMAid0571]|uniref:AraC family transcriptional regulator n=1 Tax=Reichenbachiella sp. MALMAid0571 TaxID=3143939 RepID=UPI0032DF266B
MKPILEKLTLEPKFSFVVLKDVLPYYLTPWHYHPEYELVLVVKSTGQRIVGDKIENFTDGDLVLMGPNLPHVYNNDSQYYEGNDDLKAEAIVIHFTEDSLGNGFFDLPEMALVKQLLKTSERGMKIEGKTREIVESKMHSILSKKGSSRIIELLSILDILSATKEYRLLASPGFMMKNNTSGTERITKVHEYIMMNFKKDITLDEVAGIANMVPNSFCRLFKSCTRKTFSSFLNEIRIGYACKLISEERQNIAEICYSSGFNNLSNFNRQFKKITQKSPLQYKREYQSTMD